MPVPFQQYIAKSAAVLDKAGGVAPFTNVLDQIIPVLDVSSPADRWEYLETNAGLLIGEQVAWTLPAVPDDELHSYSFIGLEASESGNKRCIISLASPNPLVGTNSYRYTNVFVSLPSGLNLLGHHFLIDNQDGFTPGPLIVPPRFRLSVRMVTNFTTIDVIFLALLRLVSRPPFETRQAVQEFDIVIS